MNDGRKKRTNEGKERNAKKKSMIVSFVNWYESC